MDSSLIERVVAELGAEPRDRAFPNVRPRDAATLIVLDRSGRVPKALMGRRRDDLRFMPGKFVFPGGRIEPGDRAMNAAGALDADVERRLMARVQRPSPSRARALALAAIRETFEETGVALGARDYGAPPEAPEGTWRDFAALGLYPPLDEVQFVARAITPPRRPKRFDTRFFAVDADAIGGRVEGVVGPHSELVEIVWQPIDRALELDLPVITRVVLAELRARIDAGYDRRLPTPFYYEVNRRWRRELL
jgi:8-oxo-dGTP pyrophosphatase MutT (NUDIX family)